MNYRWVVNHSSYSNLQAASVSFLEVWVDSSEPVYQIIEKLYYYDKSLFRIHRSEDRYQVPPRLLQQIKNHPLQIVLAVEDDNWFYSGGSRWRIASKSFPAILVALASIFLLYLIHGS